MLHLHPDGQQVYVALKNVPNSPKQANDKAGHLGGGRLGEEEEEEEDGISVAAEVK